jgi:hypothetical protein
MAYLPATAHVTPLATLRRERMLPLAGTVVVQAKQRVEPSDVVARTLLANGHRLVDVARALGLPDDQADSAMVKHQGDAVKAGEPIAVRKTGLGLMRRTARSPVEGRLVVAAGGKALLAAIAEPFELRAAIPGQVVTILQSQGVVIETTGALLEGVWGNGKEDTAPLRVVGDNPRTVLAPNLVAMEQRGAILVAGTLSDPAALKQLSDVGVRGLLVGSLVAALLPAVQKAGFPVLVLEGFGNRGFSAPAFNLLMSNSGRPAWLNAQPADRFAGRRPELIIPLPGPATPPPQPVDGQTLAIGRRVRVVRGPETGKVGTVTDLSDRPMVTPSGLRVLVAGVALEGAAGPAARVAFANLELLE